MRAVGTAILRREWIYTGTGVPMSIRDPDGNEMMSGYEGSDHSESQTRMYVCCLRIDVGNVSWNTTPGLEPALSASSQEQHSEREREREREREASPEWKLTPFGIHYILKRIGQRHSLGKKSQRAISASSVSPHPCTELHRGRGSFSRVSIQRT
jgi:hypothetical protein